MFFALGFTACREPTPPPLPHIDTCQSLPELKLEAVPSLVHVNAAVRLIATGGSGHYQFNASTGGSGGELRDDRFITGPTPATDTLTVTDDCGNFASATIEVRGAFFVAPTRATVKPGQAFTVTTSGTLGTVTFTAQSITSGGSINAKGEYRAGTTDGLDLIVVQDTGTGEQVLLQYQVRAAARFHASPAKLALPAGAQAPLTVVDGSGHVTWEKLSGPGTITAGVFVAAENESGTAQLKGTDLYTLETTTVTVRLLEELSRTGRPHGRLSDQNSIVTGDFDGDGFPDVAVGVPESDLAFPQGGAVFIYKGSASGLPATATWTILGESDTAQLGAVMAAGDLNDDGRDDLALSAPGADVITGDSGAVLLYQLTSEGPRRMRNDLSGAQRAANFGAALAIADVDGDGANDLVVGSPGADLAPTPQISNRGIVDVFLRPAGALVPDQPTFRLGGWDLAFDGTLKASNNLRFGRSLAVGDFDGDGVADLAFNGAVAAPTADGGGSRTQVAVAVHFGRASVPRFTDKPDLYVLPANFADGDEGTLRLGFVGKEASRPAMLLTALDRADSPNLVASDAGTAGGTNGGGVYLFDLSTYGRPTSTTRAQVLRTQAFAQFFGDAANTQAGRSFSVVQLDAASGSSLVLGAPYATVTSQGVNAALAGKLLVFPLSGLTAGTVANRPVDFRGGGRAEALGTSVASWRAAGMSGLVAMASRATTAAGDFTGRVDAFSGSGPLSTWNATSALLPAQLAAEQFGVTVETLSAFGKSLAWVGAPGFSGPDSNNYGGDTLVGQTVRYELGQSQSPLVVHEGAVNAYLRDGGWRFGGRASGVDLALTDFNGDGQKDLAIAVPGFATPLPTNTDYAQLPTDAGCTPPAAKTVGGITVQLSRGDGTFKESHRVWAPDLMQQDCDAGSCQRLLMGRAGIAGGFDFNGDGVQDVAMTRTAGLEILPGRSADDASLTKLTAVCQPLYSLPPFNLGTFGPVALGDLDGDGCDEVAVRYGNLNFALVDSLAVPLGVMVVFGFDPGGRCGAHTTPAVLRISGEPEAGLTSMQFGFAAAPVGAVLGDTRSYIAISARLYPFQGVAQPAVLLYERSQLGALRPTSTNMEVVPAMGGPLKPLPVVYKERAPQFGRAIAGNVDLTGDGIVDLVVGAPRANLNGDGTGAIFVFAGGPALSGARESVLTFFGDDRERGNFGQELSLTPSPGSLKALLGIGAPLSYRTGTANGAAFITSLDF